MAFNRRIAIDVLEFQGVKVGHGTAFIDDQTFCDAVRPFLNSPPPPGTIIEVEYGTGKPETQLYCNESHQVP